MLHCHAVPLETTLADKVQPPARRALLGHEAPSLHPHLPVPCDCGAAPDHVPDHVLRLTACAPPLQFGTTFEEMDALSGRRQTTKGIWLAAAGKIPAPRTLVLDLEGSDGRERGEDDNSFERQSALFALAVADCLLVNMWAKDVGREAGAGKPLLKTIFQARCPS